jgi:GxxExxY protein
MNQTNYKYSDITQQIIGCAMKVHRHFGLGFPEAIYKRSLLIELEKSGLAFQAEIDKDIYYNGHFIGKRRLDIIVAEKVLVELKAVSETDKSNYNQLLNYLNIFKMEVGLLLNFGKDSLEFKRFALSEKHQRNQ